MNLACLSNNKEASKVRGKLNKVIEEEGEADLICDTFLVCHCQDLSFTSSYMDSYWKILSRRVTCDIFHQVSLATDYLNSQKEDCYSFPFLYKEKKNKNSLRLIIDMLQSPPIKEKSHNSIQTINYPIQ